MSDLDRKMPLPRRYIYFIEYTGVDRIHAAQAVPQKKGHPDWAEGQAVRDVCGKRDLYRGCDHIG